MSNSATQPFFDGREMATIHAVFRRELGLAPRTIRGVEAGDVERARLVAGHVQGILQMLHHHHVSEDEFVWPRLLQRAPEQVAPLVAIMEAQHQDVAKLGTEVTEALATFGQTTTVWPGEDVAQGIERMLPVLVEHLDTEEQRVVPLMEQHITQAEWNQMVQSGAADVPPEVASFGFGMMMYEGEPEVIDAAIANMPSEAQPLIRRLGADAYAAKAKELYGTATPPRSTDL
jgi:iron-sulfur cluster repair protein YtfE (RIC family)